MDDFITLRALVVGPSTADRNLLRKGAALASVPVEMVEAASVAEAREALPADIDVVLLDARMAGCSEVAAACRALPKSPLLVLIAGAGPNGAADADDVVPKPREIEQARLLLESYVRLKIPCRALVVDDSATMRAIVRKILAASRFPLEIAEAGEGSGALRQIDGGRFELVFLDYNMPGLNGLETLSEIKRINPAIEVILMTSAQENGIEARARAAGAAAFLKKPFYPADVDALLNRFHGRRAMYGRVE
jgi:CheY-like chemotaxis protein